MNVYEIFDWSNAQPLVKQTLIVIGVLLLSYISYVVTTRYILKWIGILVEKSKSQLDDIIFDKILSRRLGFIFPLLILYNFAYLVPKLTFGIQRLALSLLFLILLTTFSSFLNAVNDIYERKKQFTGRPIKGYIQAIIITMYILGILVLIGILTDQSLWVLLSGVGALTAVVLLIFRDTILSIVASLQITSNDLVRLDDWIEVPAFNADGDVVDIALHTIKVRNWDKTITVIPTHKLIDQSFKNWRGMQESGGRRIKRSIHIDISSIRFCDESMLARFEKIILLKPYLEEKQKELKEDNQARGVDQETNVINARRLTNIGTFRAYVGAYLRNSSKIHQNMTFLVRQLQPDPTGIPIEIYVFSTDTAWANYEAIQSDIFDHVLAVIGEFELRVFQYPAGWNLEMLKR